LNPKRRARDQHPIFQVISRPAGGFWRSAEGANQGPCRHEHNQFGPWHLADRVTLPYAIGPLDTSAHDAFAIRYRVIRRDFPRRKM
jgi:hypothetical protein